MERQRLLGSKGSLVLQNISEGMANLWKECAHLLYSQGRDRLALYELNKGTLVYSQAERQGPPGIALEYDYNDKSKSKNQFSTRSQSSLSPCNTFRKSL